MNLILSQRMAEPNTKKRKNTSVAQSKGGVCFKCYRAGGDLAVCARRDCHKAYHPSCINIADSLLLYMKYVCDRHICHCGSPSHYACYTCIYSSCKRCIKKADFSFLRKNKGLCRCCIGKVARIEKNQQAQADLSEKSGSENLFRDYWIYLKGKYAFTTEELNQARSLNKGSAVFVCKEEPTNLVEEANDSNSRSSFENLEVANSEKRKSMSCSKSSTPDGSSSETRVCNYVGVSTLCDTQWASKQLLDFVAHMKSGDASVLSHFDVKALLLEYISRHKLRDPHNNSQIICDSRLENLFGKAYIGHFEMFRHIRLYHMKNETQAEYIQAKPFDKKPFQLETRGNSIPQRELVANKRGKIFKRGENISPEFDHDNFAAVSVAYWSEPMEASAGKRLKVQKKGERRPRQTDLDYAVIDMQFRTRGNTKHLKKVDAYKIPKLHARGDPNLGDYAAINFHNMDPHGGTVSKPDSSMDPHGGTVSKPDSSMVTRFDLDNGEIINGSDEMTDVSSWNWEKKDNHSDRCRKARNQEPASVLDTGTGVCQVFVGSDSSPKSVQASLSEAEKLWHYQDPSGKIQGPFSLVQLCKWSTKSSFPANLRIWRTMQLQKDSILLIEALDNVFSHPTNVTATYDTGLNRCSNNQYDGTVPLNIELILPSTSLPVSIKSKNELSSCGASRTSETNVSSPLASRLAHELLAVNDITSSLIDLPSQALTGESTRDLIQDINNDLSCSERGISPKFNPGDCTTTSHAVSQEMTSQSTWTCDPHAVLRVHDLDPKANSIAFQPRECDDDGETGPRDNLAIISVENQGFVTEPQPVVDGALMDAGVGSVVSSSELDNGNSDKLLNENQGWDSSDPAEIDPKLGAKSLEQGSDPLQNQRISHELAPEPMTMVSESLDGKSATNQETLQLGSVSNVGCEGAQMGLSVDSVVLPSQYNEKLLNKNEGWDSLNQIAEMDCKPEGESPGWSSAPIQNEQKPLEAAPGTVTMCDGKNSQAAIASPNKELSLGRYNDECGERAGNTRMWGCHQNNGHSFSSHQRSGMLCNNANNWGPLQSEQVSYGQGGRARNTAARGNHQNNGHRSHGYQGSVWSNENAMCGSLSSGDRFSDHQRSAGSYSNGQATLGMGHRGGLSRSFYTRGTCHHYSQRGRCRDGDSGRFSHK